MQGTPLFLLLLLQGFSGVWLYLVPSPKVEILSKGFRVSIRDDANLRKVAFNINRNHAFSSFGPGEFSGQVPKPINNRWSLEVPQQLEDGDVIYIWFSIQYNLSVYRHIAEPITVNSARQMEEQQEEIDLRTSTNITNAQIDIKPTQGAKDNTPQCVLSTTIYNTDKKKNQQACKGQLIFQDDFDDNLNLNVWSEEIRLPPDDSGDSEFVLYDTNAVVSGGILTITPTLRNNGTEIDIRQGEINLGERCTGTRPKECRRQPGGNVHNVLPPITTGRINTKQHFSFKFGRVEIRAKLPIGDWLGPLLLLEPLSSRYGLNNYASGEMRIAYARGNNNLNNRHGLDIGGRTVYGGVIIAPRDVYRNNFMVNTSRNMHFGEDYHVYTLIWNDREIILKVDNDVYGTISGGFSNSPILPKDAVNMQWNAGSYMAPFDEEFYLTIGVSSGGHCDFPDGSTSSSDPKPWENTAPKAAFRFWQQRNKWKHTWSSPELNVDYVRIYAL